MLDNHGNVVNSKTYQKDLERQGEEAWQYFMKLLKEEEISKRTGRLNIHVGVIDEEYTEEKKIAEIYRIFTKYYMHKTNIYKGQLDEYDIKSIIWECAWNVSKLDLIEISHSLNHFIYNEVRGACANEAKKRKAIKRGGQTKFVYLDDPNTFLNIDTKEDITKIELKVWAEQIKSNLTTNEYKYIKLLLNISYIPTNREVAYLLNMTPEGVRYIKNSLKSKLPSLF